MQTQTTFTFTFKEGDRTYSFNIVAETKEDAIQTLRNDLASIIAQTTLP